MDRSNQVKFIEQQRADSHSQVAKTMTETIDILLIIHTVQKRQNREGFTK